MRQISLLLSLMFALLLPAARCEEVATAAAPTLHGGDDDAEAQVLPVEITPLIDGSESSGARVVNLTLIPPSPLHHDREQQQQESRSSGGKRTDGQTPETMEIEEIIEEELPPETNSSSSSDNIRTEPSVQGSSSATASATASTTTGDARQEAASTSSFLLPLAAGLVIGVLVTSVTFVAATACLLRRSSGS